MNYSEFRLWRDRLLQTRSPRRLDCMNPEIALAPLRPTPPEPFGIDGGDAVAEWSTAGGVSIAAGERVVGTGVRSILQAALSSLVGRVDGLWLPGDVYPVYWELSAGLPRRRFRTLPEIDWRFLDDAGPRDALLIPHPLSPLGRPLTALELERLQRWTEPPGRRLIVDAAYQLRAPFDDRLSRATVIWSLSKPWISRGLLGLARVPAELRDELQARVPLPEPAALSAAASLLRAAPDLPAELARRFSAEWTRLTPAIRAASPDWRPPECGYFSIVPVAAERLLAEHDLLAIPASVFGSQRADLSVVTCLHDLTLCQY